MTNSLPRSPIFFPVLALAFSAFPAAASEVICDGLMVLADCSPVGATPWSVSSQPTFTASCKPCPTPTFSDDGGTTTCGPWAPADPRQFQLSGPNIAPGTHPTDFETAGACGDATMFRYTGPLVAGDYVLWLNSNGHSTNLRFTVVDALPEPDAGAPDAAASAPDAGVAVDAGSGAGGESESGSCACVAVRGRDVDAGVLALLALAAVGVVGARRASPRRRS